METGFTIFLTYQLEDAPASLSNNYGYSNTIHCAYLQKITTDNLNNKTLGLLFKRIDDFPFLADENSINGTGFTATKINALVQIVEGISDSENTITPSSSEWYKVDITNQIENHTIGTVISKNKLVKTKFFIDLKFLNDKYNLDYLNYTKKGTILKTMLFGEETIFFGNVTTDIKATLYTTDIPIVLPLNNYNSTTNPTWDGSKTIGITEIGIYDDNNNLVAIGKINKPIKKDSTIARTIAFQLDF